MKIDLKKFRQAHRLFQSEIAEMLDINQSNVSRAEIRGYFELDYNQENLLVEKFGREDVEAFEVSGDVREPIAVIASGNHNEGDGTQNNGYFGADAVALSVIKQQSEALTNLAEKQAAQNDRLMMLLEKLSEKL